MQVYWKGSVCKRNTKIQVNCVQSCNLLSGMCANELSPNNLLSKIDKIILIDWLGLWVLTPLSTIFQLYSGSIY
jgi:hypothetical protein